MNKPVVLIIRDGWGIGPDGPGNAVSNANTPNLDACLSRYPYAVLGASGESVGLLAGAQGSSEVGHLNMGAGRVVEQEVVRINKIIADRSFFSNEGLLEAAATCKRNGSAFHAIGLVQDQGVHAMDTHLFALLEFAKQNALEDVYIHFISDGRDTPPRSALTYLSRLRDRMAGIGIGTIASVMGRYYAMDRDQNWDRTILAYNALVKGQGLTAASAEEAIASAYQRDESDEFIKPTLIADAPGRPLATVKPGDSLIFFNYRQDRAIQLSKAFVEDGFGHFERARVDGLYFLGFTKYYDSFPCCMIPPMDMSNILGEVLQRAHIRQLRVSETQKFKHVTSFLNSKREEPFRGEDRILVQSPKEPEDKVPEMSAYKLADILVDVIKDGRKAVDGLAPGYPDMTYYPNPFDGDGGDYFYDVIICNFVNGDMVGHTGSFPAAVKAAEVVDACVGRVVEATLAMGGVALVTADHGNFEQMIDPVTGGPQTAHSTNDVHFIYIAKDYSEVRVREKGVLSDIALTILDLMGLQKPPEMTSASLLIK